MRKSSTQPRRQRIADMFPYRQSEAGCPLCVICGVELRRKDGQPRRKDARYCSKTCREDAWVRSGDTAVIRGLLLERDKGFCGSCGLDCVALEVACQRCLDLGFHATQHTWEAHHIVSVADGGGGCGLEGYATLCRQCHKRANTELATRRASQREEAKTAGTSRPWWRKAGKEVVARRALPGDDEPAGQMNLPFS